jgi:hypothetical protein
VKAPTDTTYWIPLIDYLLDGLAVGTPIGTIIMWASATNPQDGGVWLDCNGQDCTAYPKLAAIVGNNVPNLQGLFPRCVGTQDLIVTVGEETTTQTFDGGSVGDKSADAIRDIYGTFSGVGNIGETNQGTVTGAFYRFNETKNPAEGAEISNEGSRDDYFGFRSSLVVPTATENKPVSVSLRFLIKAQ